MTDRLTLAAPYLRRLIAARGRKIKAASERASRPQNPRLQADTKRERSWPP
jgi:hypothetical protein